MPGIKAAAVRKLQHELGISPASLPASSFKYLTRLHYCAADTQTHGPDSPWGEHEVDYILVARAQVGLLVVWVCWWVWCWVLGRGCWGAGAAEGPGGWAAGAALPLLAASATEHR